MACVRNEKKLTMRLVCKLNNKRKQWNILSSLGIGQRKVSDLPPHLSDPVFINNYFAGFCSSDDNNCEKLVDYYMQNLFAVQGRFWFRLASVDEVHK